MCIACYIRVLFLLFEVVPFEGARTLDGFVEFIEKMTSASVIIFVLDVFIFRVAWRVQWLFFFVCWCW